LRPVGNKYPNQLPQQNAPAPAPQNPGPVQTQQPAPKAPLPPRGSGGKFSNKPPISGDPQAKPPGEMGSVNWEEPTLEPDAADKGHRPAGRGPDNVDFKQDPNVKAVNPWNNILQTAGKDNNAGREFITLLGSMYQAKRRNPSIQLTMPKMVSSLKDGELKNQMTKLFQMAQKEDLPQLAALSKQIQDARMNKNKETQQQGLPPGQQGGQQGQQQAQQGQQPPEVQSVLQQLSKMPKKGLVTVKKKISDILKQKQPEPKPTPIPSRAATT
jgi:hypothetical protein